MPGEASVDDQAAPRAFYLPIGGGRFVATESCVGPWFADAQHVGPPSALLIRAIEQCAPRHELQLARVTVEVLGAVPAGEVTVTATVERPGRTIELLGAQMSAAGRTVLRARAWRLATTPTEDAAGGAAPALPPLPTAQGWRPPAGWLPGGYLDAVEWRWLHGGFDVPGEGQVWARPRVPVVAGEQPTAIQRVAVVADAANGVGARLDITRWLYVNVELTVHLHGAPRGEWVGVDAHTVIGSSGLGTVSANLFDLSGHVGRATQQLTVRRR